MAKRTWIRKMDKGKPTIADLEARIEELESENYKLNLLSQGVGRGADATIKELVEIADQHRQQYEAEIQALRERLQRESPIEFMTSGEIPPGAMELASTSNYTHAGSNNYVFYALYYDGEDPPHVLWARGGFVGSRDVFDQYFMRFKRMATFLSLDEDISGDLAGFVPNEVFRPMLDQLFDIDPTGTSQAYDDKRKELQAEAWKKCGEAYKDKGLTSKNFSNSFIQKCRASLKNMNSRLLHEQGSFKSPLD